MGGGGGGTGLGRRVVAVLCPILSILVYKPWATRQVPELIRQKRYDCLGDRHQTRKLNYL